MAGTHHEPFHQAFEFNIRCHLDPWSSQSMQTNQIECPTKYFQGHFNLWIQYWNTQARALSSFRCHI